MRIYVIFAGLAALCAVLGFLGLVAGWIGIALWILAVFCALASWLSWRARAAARADPDPE